MSPASVLVNATVESLCDPDLRKRSSRCESKSESKSQSKLASKRPQPHRPRAAWALMSTLVLASFASCGRNQTGPSRPPPLEELEAALAPAAMSQALRKAGGGHYHGVVTLEIDTPASGGQGPSKDAVTTTTDVWMDQSGNYRLVESNDRDGGREIVLFGRQLAVAMRYARMIRRPMQEGEGTRFIEEALGGPMGAWAIARRFAEVTRRVDPSAPPPAANPQSPASPPAPATFEVKKANEAQASNDAFESGVPPLQRWRETVDVQSLSGKVRLDGRTSLPMAAQMEARFSLTRDSKRLTGLVRVDSRIQGLGQVKPIEAPQAEELPVRQRTILEERALLGPRTVPEPARRQRGEAR